MSFGAESAILLVTALRVTKASDGLPDLLCALNVMLLAISTAFSYRILVLIGVVNVVAYVALKFVV